MENYNSEQLYDVISKKQSEVLINYESEFNNFKRKLLNEIEQLFRYYQVAFNLNKVEYIIDEHLTDFKNKAMYKKIMNKSNDMFFELRNVPDDKIKEFSKFSISELNQMNRKTDLVDAYMELISDFKKRIPMKENAFDELRIMIRGQVNRLQDTIMQSNDTFIKTSEQILTQQNTLGISNSNQVLNNCTKAIHTLSPEQAIEFLENEFSMLDEKQVTTIINNLLSETPSDEIKNYLENKINELRQLANEKNKESSLSSAFL